MQATLYSAPVLGCALIDVPLSHALCMSHPWPRKGRAVRCLVADTRPPMTYPQSLLPGLWTACEGRGLTA